MCPIQVPTRLLLATLHTLTVYHPSRDDVLAVGRHRNTRVVCVPLKVWTSQSLRYPDVAELTAISTATTK